MAGKVQVARRERLSRICKHIIDGGSHNVDDDTVAQFKSAALRFVHTQYDDETEGLEALYRADDELGSSLRKAVEVIDEADRADNVAKARNRGAGGHRSLTGALIEHLHDRLERRREQHGYQKKESNMPSETLESILKDGCPVSLCKAIVDRARSPCGEHELVAALSKAAGGDRAFAKLYETEPDVQRACSIANSAEFSVFDIKPVVVGSVDAMNEANDDDDSAVLRAHEEIVRIAREKFPFLPSDVAFARVFEDRNYAALAAQAHQRPGPTTVYAMPTAVTKSGRDFGAPNDSAYAALMVKAEQLRSERPELSVAQCFAKIYTDRGNVELAKRERIESSPR